MEVPKSGSRQVEYDWKDDANVLPSKYHSPTTSDLDYVSRRVQSEPELHQRNKQGGGQ